MIFTNKRVLVTGATGFIGRVLVHRLLEGGAYVVPLSRHGNDGLHADLTDRFSVKRALEGQSFDVIFHLAGAGTNPHQDQDVSLLHTNAEGMENLLAVLEGLPACPIVAAGSWTEYGPSATGMMCEDDACFPTSTYGISKLAQTLTAIAWAKRVERPLTVLRFFQVYGTGERENRLGPTLVRAWDRGEAPQLGQSDIRRDFVSVEDVVEALCRAVTIRQHGLILNVGTGQAFALSQVATWMRDAYGSKAIEPVWGTSVPRPWDVAIAYADTTRLRETIGWVPACSIRDDNLSLIDTYRHELFRSKKSSLGSLPD